MSLSLTQAEIYDWLIKNNVAEPAVLQMGDRFVVGRWVDMNEKVPNGYILRSGRLAVVVLGEGDTLEAAHEAAKARLA